MSFKQVKISLIFIYYDLELISLDKKIPHSVIVIMCILFKLIKARIMSHSIENLSHKVYNYGHGLINTIHIIRWDSDYGNFNEHIWFKKCACLLIAEKK